MPKNRALWEILVIIKFQKSYKKIPKGYVDIPKGNNKIPIGYVDIPKGNNKIP